MPRELAQSVRPRWPPFIIVVALSAALLGFDLGSRVITTNDEARFPMMARDIRTNGHWLLPELSGVPLLNKPPLHAWLIAIAAWPTGAVSQRTAVIPSFVAAMGLVATTYWIAERVVGPGAGLTAGLIVATAVGVFAMARSAVPDMTLSFGIAAAMAAFMAAELDGRRGAWVGFYGLVGVACWAKGPAGLLPIIVVVAYQLATSGWRGLTRMRAMVGIAMLVVLVVPWWALAAHVGRDRFVYDVAWADLAQGYNPFRAPALYRVVKPLESAVTIFLPWSLLLPFALVSAIRRWKTDSAAGERLALVWAITVLMVVAASYRQRWRYYLPLCVPGALLVTGWLCSGRIGRRMGAALAVWAVTAVTLMIGEIYVVERENRGTQLNAIAQALEGAQAPVFALDAPELVLSFHLGRQIARVPNQAAFRGLDPPVYVIARNPPAQESFDPIAEGSIKGRRVVLWAKR